MNNQIRGAALRQRFSALVPFVETLEARALFSAGALDASFGESGILTIAPLRPEDVYTVAAAQTPDGKTLELGRATLPGQDVVLARFNQDGSLDTTFGQSGSLQAPGNQLRRHSVLARAADPSAMTVDRQGRIYVVGAAGVVRLLPSGAPDSTFGAAGFVALNHLLLTSHAIALAPDGSIWIGGSAYRRFSLVHLTADGSLIEKTVAAFTRAGKLTAAEIHAIAVQPDGKVVAAGGGASGFDIARFNPDGTLNSTFNANGTASLPGTGSAVSKDASIKPGFYFNAITLTQSGEALAAGGSPLGQAGSMVVAEFGRDGKPDPAFGTGGVTTVTAAGSTRSPSGLSATGLAVMADGQLLISGTLTGRYANAVIAARLNADGTPDAGFGADAGAPGLRFVTNPLPATATDPPFAAGLLLRRYGAFAVPGGGGSAKSPYQQLALYGLDSAGKPDAYYARHGSAVATVNQPDSSVPNFLQTDSAGRIYLGERRDRTFALTRYNPDGTVDPSFGAAGDLLGLLPIAVTPDGKIYAQRQSAGGGVDLLRYKDDGSLDSSFGTGGIVHFSDGADFHTINTVLQRPDGSLLVDVRADAADVIHSVTATGQSTATLTIGAWIADAGPTNGLASLAVSPDGQKLVLAVHAGGLTPFVYIERYNAADLSPDTTFGQGGSASIQGYEAPAIAVAAGGTIYVQSLATVVSLDASGVQKWSTHVAGTGYYGVDSLLLESDGKLLTLPTELETGPLVISRLNSDGTRDTTFGDSSATSLFDHLLPDYGPPTVRAALQRGSGGEKLIVASVFADSPLDAIRANYIGSDIGFLARVDL